MVRTIGSDEPFLEEHLIICASVSGFPTFFSNNFAKRWKKWFPFICSNILFLFLVALFFGLISLLIFSIFCNYDIDISNYVILKFLQCGINKGLLLLSLFSLSSFFFFTLYYLTFLLFLLIFFVFFYSFFLFFFSLFIFFFSFFFFLYLIYSSASSCTLSSFPFFLLLLFPCLLLHLLCNKLCL